MSLALVRNEALRLSSEERAELAELLWESLEDDTGSARQSLWAQEAEDRIDAFEKGELAAIDGPEALNELRRSLRK